MDDLKNIINYILTSRVILYITISLGQASCSVVGQHKALHRLLCAFIWLQFGWGIYCLFVLVVCFVFIVVCGLYFALFWDAVFILFCFLLLLHFWLHIFFLNKFLYPSLTQSIQTAASTRSAPLNSPPNPPFPKIP